VKGVHKPFNKLDYMKFDGPAKQAMRIHLELSGYRVTVPPENYGADLYSELGTIKIYHEVEVSQAWEGGEHPFSLGSIPERKLRLAEMHINEPLYFWMLRLDLLRALVFPSFRLRPEFLVEVPNKKVARGEYFYRIPKQFGKEFDMLWK
jgi:hypothetical protein